MPKKTVRTSQQSGEGKPYTHEHFTATPDHSNTTPVNLNWRGHGSTDLIPEVLVKHFKCEDGTTSCIGVYACNKEAQRWVRQH
jgi:hypothetical protein